MTTPRRFVLGSAGLAGALAVAGVEVSSDSGLPAPRKVDRKTLRQAGVLDGDTLDPSLATALGVLVNPGRMLRVRANRAGRMGWVETRLTTASGTEAVVAWADRDGDFDVAVLANTRQAVVLVDELLGVTDFVAGEPEGRYELSLDGFVALLAAADLHQRAALANRLDRALRRPPPILEPDALRSLVEDGLTHADTRWVVTAAAGVAPVALGTTSEKMGRGLVELEEAGLVATTPQGRLLSGAGFGVAEALGQLIVTGSLASAVPGADGRATATRISVFRCATAIWGASWYGGGDGIVRVTLLELDHSAALGIVEDMLGDLEILQPAVAADGDQVVCPACGASNRADTQSCATCGKPRITDNRSEVRASDTTARLAGACSECGTNVWLEDWRCSKGHPRESVSGWYDPASGTRVTPPWLSGDGPPPPPPPPPA